MKDLKKFLRTHEFWSSILMFGGVTIIGSGIYDLARSKPALSNFKINMGSIISVIGAGYYLGRQHERELNKKNYQTKTEDYKSKE